MNKHDQFILTLFSHGFKARGTTISHVLRGKRTSFILTYGFLFNLLKYFGLFPLYEQAVLEKSLSKLVNLGYLHMWENYYQLTHNGKIYLEKNKKQIKNYPSLNGFQYSRWDEDYIETLLFISQVVSELVHENTSYKPIDNNPVRQNKVKKWMASQKLNRKELGMAFFSEWEKLIGQLPESQRLNAVLFITGHEQIGKTWEQLTHEQPQNWLTNKLFKKNSLHFILSQIENNPTDYPCFTSIYESGQYNYVNESAVTTYQLFKRGESIERICQERRLKQSTVHDHLIEFAIVDPQFDYSKIISPDQRNQLCQLVEILPPIQEWTFKEISQRNAAIDFMNFRFFQIEQVRLKYGK